jgi:hypothetical protein
LKFNPVVKNEMQKIDELEFNIFKVQEFTQNNELVSTAAYILAKHDIFSNINCSFEVFLNFIKKIQSGYKDITYHNKTHAADLC